MKKAFTARELAELGLDCLPKLRGDVSRKATRENWPSRPRQGAGGGREFPFAELPLNLQAAIMRQCAEQNTLTDAPCPMPDAAQAAPRAKDRAAAKAVIVAAFEKLRSHVGDIKTAEADFINTYAAEAAMGGGVSLPAWLFKVYPSFSIQALRRWRSEAKAGHGVLQHQKRGRRRGQSVLAQANEGKVGEYIAALLVKNTHINAGHIRDLCRATFGAVLDMDGRSVPLPKIRAFERYIIQWKAVNASLYEKMTNPDGYKNRHQMAIGRNDAGVVRLNQVWEIDASPADTICVDGRYSTYCIIDVWSRRSLFSVSKTPRTEASLLLVRRAILEWGVPETLKTDNGSDFVSKRFMAAVASLGIHQHICPPFSPEKKAFVERMIGTMQRELMPLLPGFTGHNVADRKRIEGMKTFSQRLGEGDDKSFGVSLSHEQLQAHMDRWATDVYAQRHHGGLGKIAPAVKAASWKEPVRMVENIRALDLLLAPLAEGDGFRVIGKKGIRVANGHFYGAGLELYMGKRVMVRHDPEDMGRVFVFTEDEDFICEAINIDRLGVDPAAAAAEAKARQKQITHEGSREIRRLARQMTPELVTETYLSPAAREAAKVSVFPHAGKTYSTKSLDEAARAERKRRIAPRQRTAEEAVKHEAFVKDFKEFQQSAEKKKSNVERWKDRAREIEAKMDTGGNISEADSVWLEDMKSESWYKAWKNAEAHKAALEGA